MVTTRQVALPGAHTVPGVVYGVLLGVWAVVPYLVVRVRRGRKPKPDRPPSWKQP